MDCGLLKVALACCSLAVTRIAEGQDAPPWYILAYVGAFGDASSTPGLVQFETKQKVPAGATSIVVPGRDCWTYEYCGSNCAASVSGDLHVAISAQSIIVSATGGFPAPPSGQMSFYFYASQATLVTWPGGSQFFPGKGDWSVQVPVTVHAAGFPIIFSSDVTLQSVYVSMYAETPGSSWTSAESSGAGCEPYCYPDDCSHVPPFIAGTLAASAGIGDAEGFRCVCGPYSTVGSTALAYASCNLAGNRLDVAIGLDWGCPERIEYLQAFAGARIGIDRPIRVAWDAKCGMGGILGHDCGGPGSVELWPHPDQECGPGQYNFILLSTGALLKGYGSPPIQGSIRQGVQNLRFERMFPADVIPDGNVDASDIAAILSKWGGPYDPHRTAADVNLDGQVSAEDLSAVLFAWGTPG